MLESIVNALQVQVYTPGAMTAHCALIEQSLFPVRQGLIANGKIEIKRNQMKKCVLEEVTWD